MDQFYISGHQQNVRIDNQLGKTCKITAPSKEGNPTIVVQAFTGDGEWIGVKEEEIKVADCKLSFSYRKFWVIIQNQHQEIL